MSIAFTEEAESVIKRLKKTGHTVYLPFYTDKILKGETSFKDYMNTKNTAGDSELRKMVGKNLIKRHYGLIKDSDSILVLNYEKSGVKNYIGGSTLMEMGFAYILDKRIYLFNGIPDMSYTDEIKDMNPTIINSDLSLVK